MPTYERSPYYASLLLALRQMLRKSFNVINLNPKVFLLYEDENGLSLKTILVVADGMADRPIKELGFKTPLEAATKPNLDRIVKHGICGIMDPIAPGIPPGSDTSTLAIFGYDPFKVYSGRGALEAEGSSVEVLPGDVAFRCNFATVNDNLVVLDRRAGIVANATISGH